VAQFIGSTILITDAFQQQLGVTPQGAVYHSPNVERWFIVAVGDRYLVRSARFQKHLGCTPEGRVYTHTNQLQWEQWAIRLARVVGAEQLADRGRREHDLHAGARVRAESATDTPGSQ